MFPISKSLGYHRKSVCKIIVVLHLSVCLQCESCFCKDELVDSMRQNPYSISTDGSNDNSIRKMFPITGTVEVQGQLVTQFLDMCTGESGTAKGSKICVYLCQ